jgi:hypothetical protein
MKPGGEHESTRIKAGLRTQQFTHKMKPGGEHESTRIKAGLRTQQFTKYEKLDLRTENSLTFSPLKCVIETGYIPGDFYALWHEPY